MSGGRAFLIRIVGTTLPPREIETEDEGECPACVAIGGVTRAPGLEFGGAWGVGATPIERTEVVAFVAKRGDSPTEARPTPTGPERFYLTERVDPFDGLVGVACKSAPGATDAEREAACREANEWVRAAIEDGAMVVGAEAEAAREADGSDEADAAREKRAAAGEPSGMTVLAEMAEMFFSPHTWALRKAAEFGIMGKKAAERARRAERDEAKRTGDEKKGDE